MDITTLFDGDEVLPNDLELQLITDYKNGDLEAGNRFICSRMTWIFNMCKTLRLPSWVDLDQVAGDCASDIALAILNYDPALSSVTTYMFGIIYRRAPASARSQEPQKKMLAIDGDHIEPTIPDPSDTISTIRHVFDSVELNEETQLVFDRMLKGTCCHEISRQLGWNNSRTQKKIDAVRSEIAYRLLLAGESAEPWLSDKELEALAAEHQKQQGWLE